MLDKQKLEASCLTVQEFGRRLIETGDLDPVYVGLVGAHLPEDQLARWLLAYWCFYHAGSASWLSEQEGSDFWDRLWQAAANVNSPPLHGGPLRWPRAAERRHFRGDKCVRAVEHLRENRRPEDLVNPLRVLREAKNVMGAVQAWPMFGPWIAFKAADMLERCAGVPLHFPPNLGLIYSEPAEALIILFQEDAELGWRDLLAHFSAWPAPPGGDRPCGVQEVETVLCKWKSHRAGHYRVGKDIHEVREALHGWGETAERMLAAMPGEVL